MEILEHERVLMSTYLEPTKELGYSNIFLDFLNKTDKAASFYPAQSLQLVAQKLSAKKFERDTLADILTEQNKTFGSSQPVFDNIEKLRNPQTVAVVTGQQAGLFGGSLLIIIKALAIVKSAKEYEVELNQPVVPIFWIAGDDHDYEEVNHTFTLDRNSDIIKSTYSAIPSVELPTSELTFNDQDALAKAKEELKNSLGETDFTQELYDIIDNCYTSNDTYASAFGKMMASLTKEYGLILFSPGDTEAKKLAVPFFKSIIENQSEIHQLLDKTNSDLQSSEYHTQVEKSENSVHLFYNLNGRKPVLQEGDKFSVGDKVFSKDELLTAIENHPEKFSPDVMTRPLWQSILFPVVSQKGGAAEIAYLAQIHKLFDLFEIVTPFYKARPTLTVIEKRYESLIEAHQIKFSDLTGDIELLINRILAETFPTDLEGKFKDLKKLIKTNFEDFTKESISFDNSLEKFAEQIFGKIDYNLNAFESKVFSAHKKKSQDSRDRIYRLWHALYPNRTFQERVLNLAYFVSKYGFQFITFLYEQIDAENPKHKLVYLSEMEQKWS